MELRRAPVAQIGVSAAILALAACLDLEPLQGNAPAYDGALLADAAAPPGACASCIYSGVCSEPLATCASNSKCAKVLECLAPRHCLELHTQEDAYKCSVPCAYGAGITSSEDAAVLLSLNVSLCGQEQCPDVCYFSTDGTRPR